VLVDRSGKSTSISVDGTCRLLNLNGKTWPMINGNKRAAIFAAARAAPVLRGKVGARA